MANWKNRPTSSNIIDKRDEIANTILADMKMNSPKIRDEGWDMLMSPTPISPTSQKFEPTLSTGLNYSYSPVKKKLPSTGLEGMRGRLVAYAPGRIRSFPGKGGVKYK